MYGLKSNLETPLHVEMEFIKAGGFITVQGQQFGKGLFHHYREAQKLLWPEDDHHRWSDLMLQTILDNRITAITGSRDSGKTHVALARFGLTDYFAFPNNTLILISSTDLRGLRLRVWGDMVDMLKRSQERYPWLPGNVVESMHGIFTDKLDDDTPIRDIRRGLIAIPCLDRRGAWVGGLEKFVGIKQKRRRLLGDECFPAGTLVNTRFGLRPIELIVPGDTVLSAIGYRKVVATSQRIAFELIQIRLTDGRQIVCTPNHQVLTQKGWKKACEINGTHYILGPYETMSSMWKTDQQQTGMLAEVLVFNDVNTGRNCIGMYPGASKKNQYRGASENEYKQSDVESSLFQESQRCFESDGTQALHKGRKWDGANQGGMATDSDVSRSSMEFWYQNREVERERLSSLLQSGFGIPRHQACNRGRWIESRKLGQSKIQGSEEGQISTGAWVDRVEVVKQNNSGFQSTALDSGASPVYNLQVEGHPSYCVNGLVVHNCQFMHPEYLNVMSNLDEGDFKGVFVGNTIANRKALDKLAEPVEGWENRPQPTKTDVFKNKFDGVTIQLIGTDSPNFDGPADAPTRYRYMVNRQSEMRVGNRWGRDSEQYHSQISGLRKTGLFAHRVLTEEMCKRKGAFDTAIWQGEPTTKVYACDMGFGGDRCVAGYCEFGTAVGGGTVFRVNPPTEIQINVDIDPEVQIAQFIKKDCDALGIPGAHVYFDAGMRATAATSLAKMFSLDVNPVNFGGTPTKRPVCADEFVLDKDTGAKRLKRCDEHYDRFISELWFSVRYLVLSGQMKELPADVANEFYEREWAKGKGDRYELETKEEMKDRTGYSPDLADWLVLAVEGARRLGFVIENIPDPNAPPKGNDDYLERALTKYQQEQKKRRLQYA